MAPRSGTGYIGLDQWLSLNRPAATSMADKMTGNINTQGQKSTGLLNDAEEQFKYDVDGNTLSFDEEDPGLTEKLAAQKAATVYKGPDKIDDYAGFKEGRGIAENVQGDARLASDIYGRQALLQEEYGKGGGYSLGQQRLDSALVGAAGGDKIDAAKAQWGNLLGKYSDARDRSTAYGAQGKVRTADAAKQYATAGEGIKARAAAAQAKQDAYDRDVFNEQQAADALARNQQRPADSAAVDSGRIPIDDRKGGLGVDNWAAKRGQKVPSGRVKQPKNPRAPNVYE